MTIKTLAAAIAALLSVGLAASHAQAANYDLTLTGDPSGFNSGEFDFDNLHFQQYSVSLAGLSADNAITVAQGDTIDSVVTFTSSYTIPQSTTRTDLLQFLTGSSPSFPSEDTAVDGEFNFYDMGALVGTYDYSSTSSGVLASFSVLFPPQNGPLTFDAFTNDLTITGLAAPATLNGSSFTYDLVSPIAAAPEPSAWMLMIAGIGGMGLMLRRALRAQGAKVALAA